MNRPSKLQKLPRPLNKTAVPCPPKPSLFTRLLRFLLGKKNSPAPAATLSVLGPVYHTGIDSTGYQEVPGEELHSPPLLNGFDRREKPPNASANSSGSIIPGPIPYGPIDQSFAAYSPAYETPSIGPRPNGLRSHPSLTMSRPKIPRPSTHFSERQESAVPKFGDDYPSRPEHPVVAPQSSSASVHTTYTPRVPQVDTHPPRLRPSFHEDQDPKGERAGPSTGLPSTSSTISTGDPERYLPNPRSSRIRAHPPGKRSTQLSAAHLPNNMLPPGIVAGVPPERRTTSAPSVATERKRETFVRRTRVQSSWDLELPVVTPGKPIAVGDLEELPRKRIDAGTSSFDRRYSSLPPRIQGEQRRLRKGPNPDRAASTASRALIFAHQHYAESIAESTRLSVASSQSTPTGLMSSHSIRAYNRGLRATRRIPSAPFPRTRVGIVPWSGGHSEAIRTIAFSTDGTRVVSGSDDKTLRVWDMQTGSMLAVLQGHSDSVWAAAFSPDGRHVVSGSADKKLRRWDTSTGVPLAVFKGHSHTVRAVAFSPDGSIIASGSHDKTVRLWDAFTGVSLKVLKGHSHPVSSVAFNRNGTCLLSTDWFGNERQWSYSPTHSIGSFYPTVPNIVTLSYLQKPWLICTVRGNPFRMWIPVECHGEVWHSSHIVVIATEKGRMLILNLWNVYLTMA